jgi:D-amino-acid dehydrogenase
MPACSPAPRSCRSTIPASTARSRSYLGNRHPALNLDWSRALTRPGWLLRFLWEARPSKAAARIAALESLTSSTVERHRALMAEAGVTHRLRETGTLKLWRSEAGHAAAQAEHDFLKAHGIDLAGARPAGHFGVEPALNPIFHAGLLCLENASVDSPGAVTQAYAELFAQRGGRIERAEAQRLERCASGWRVVTAQGGFEADIAVVALGPWSMDLLAPLGLDPKLDVERGYHRHLRAKPEPGCRGRSTTSTPPISWRRWKRATASPAASTSATATHPTTTARSTRSR